MEKEDLIKKLKDSSIPEIEMPGHKRRLRLFLLNKYPAEKKSWEIFNIFRKLAPVGMAAVILMLFFFNDFIFPQYTLADAEKIAREDPQVQEWLKKGAAVEDIEIVKNKGYVLLQPQNGEKKVIVASKTEDQNINGAFAGALVEVDFKTKKVSKIEKIAPENFTLTEQDQNKAKEISAKNPEFQKVVPPEAEVSQIKISVPQMKLMKTNGSVKVVPEDNAKKEAQVIYEYDQKQWESNVDLNKESVENINFLGQTEEIQK